MNKKVVVLGGGTGLSSLLRGLKQFPLDITAIVSVCDDGKSTGKLRKEFNIPAVGDIRRVIVSLSETEPLIEQLLNYRFSTSSDLNNHTVGNLLLTALANITGNISDGIESLEKILNLKGKVLPLTEDNVTLMGKMEDGTIIEGEHNITHDHRKILDVFYKENPKVNPNAIDAVKKADLIILSMGSLFTSIMPNLVCKEMQKAIDKSSAKIMYVCNMTTQPGETDGFKVSDHVRLLNKYLGKRKINIVAANSGHVDSDVARRYSSLENKDIVELDKENIPKDVKIISSNLVNIEDNLIRHDAIKLSSYIFTSLL